MSKDHSEYYHLEDNIHIFHIGFDLTDQGYGQVKEKFYDELFNDIPEFAFGTDVYRSKLEAQGAMPTIREAMKAIYAIKEVKDARDKYLNSSFTEDIYLRRGEFGELLLYHFLSEYFQAEALISKIYFKDNAGMTAHGFDAVHVDLENEKLWLGESKLYIDPHKAIRSLVNDVTEHFKTDFLNSEFQIITNRVHDSGRKHADFIYKLLNPQTRTLEKLAGINIALFAGFQSEALQTIREKEIREDISREVKLLASKANNSLEEHQWREKLNIYLFFFPIDDKREFVSALHEKLKGGQKI